MRLSSTLATILVASASLWFVAPAHTRSTRDRASLEATCDSLNAAIQRRDYEAIGQIWSTDLVMSVGTRSLRGGQANLDQLRRIITKRPDLRLKYDCGRSMLSTDRTLAFHRGTWKETWTEPDGAVRLSGPFAAVWSMQDGKWRLAMLTMAPLTCRGGSYCQR